jgi:zeta-carotene desaturase
LPADFLVVAVAGRIAGKLLPDFEPPAMEHSPITSVHLWFDRSITSLPHATLLDRTIQWMFNKSGGSYVQVLVSASRSLIGKGRQEVVDLAVSELSEFFPSVAESRLIRSHVVKEVYATFSARPGLGQLRPGVNTQWPNVFVAGDWVASGWPSTMEGAVRTGYMAAEAVCAAAGQPARFLQPDIA